MNIPKLKYVYIFLLLSAFCTYSKGQTKEASTSQGPKRVTRKIIQDRKGNIWMAAFDGIFRYDGKSFTHITSKVSSARFFAVLEDKKGNFWFGSIGSGVYCYNGKSFQHFTTKEGLLNNEVGCIYEDKRGNIWFGVSGGASCYDGKSFRNYTLDGNSMKEDRTGKTFPDRQPYGVNSIMEDSKGRFWLGTSVNTFVYDGKKFTVFARGGTPFKNVRSIIEDKKGNIWLCGNEGLWRYDGSILPNLQLSFGYILEDKFTNLKKNFVGSIYEDKNGNICVNDGSWAIFRYDEKSLSSKNPIVTETKLRPKGNNEVLFWILEASDGSIWVGASDGVYRYNGNSFEDFKD